MKYTRLSGMAAFLILATGCLQQMPMPLGQNPRLMQAQTLTTQGSVIDDSDLSGPVQFNAMGMISAEAIGRDAKGLVFRAVALHGQPPRVQAGENEVKGNFQYYDHLQTLRPGANATVTLLSGGREVAKTLTDQAGNWRIPVQNMGEYQVRFTLENPRWRLNNYSWDGPAVQIQGSVDTGVYTLEKGKKNAEAAYIHELYNRTLNLFAQEGMDLSWWKAQIKTVWPGSGDYYSFNTVNLTGAHQWDVNGHEIGHAIFAQALNARSQGGAHKIDECYNGTLAFSEGFATFFSGAIQLERNAPDAHFGDYLVPRRKPIRIENTPADVCPGNQNEWRVASVLWDVYDTHGDGQDQMSLSLKEIFATFSQPQKPRINNALDAYALLQERLPAPGKAALREVFKQNTMEVE